ncbi:hypothetical protein ACQP60_04305 [Isoptericola variabilis]|uniref:hypothetical protein n=1 Tax=Isoptericola variabilis TaxID=139208 RepID=UPI003D191017
MTTIPTPRDVRGLTDQIHDGPLDAPELVVAAPAGLPLRDATPEEVDGITRLVASAVGLNADDLALVHRVRTAGALPPVLDAPARRDEPKPAPRRRGVVVEVRALDVTGAPTTRKVIFETATRWSIAPAGALRVYDGPAEEKAFNQQVWVSVDWLYDAVPATREGATR